MGLIKKLNGGFSISVSADETLLATSNSRNTVYVYDLNSRKRILQVKTVSNVHYKAFSPDNRLLAAKNTSGHMALISIDSDEELFRNKMMEREGYPMTFSEDGRFILDLDWSGRTMCLDCEHNELTILEDHPQRELPRISYMKFDRFSNQVYKFVADEFGNSKGVIMTSPANVDRINYKTVRIFNDVLPDHIRGGLSFCREHNYYIELDKNEIVVVDKNYKEIGRIQFPSEVSTLTNYRASRVFISPCERYAFFLMTYNRNIHNIKEAVNQPDLSYLYDLTTMELIQVFDYKYISDFTMIEEDSKYVIATWQGSYLYEI